MYNALESEHANVSGYRDLIFERDLLFHQVQERALKAVPDLCESIDYAEVQGVMFPRVAVGNLDHMSELWLTSRFSSSLQKLASSR